MAAFVPSVAAAAMVAPDAAAATAIVVPVVGNNNYQQQQHVDVSIPMCGCGKPAQKRVVMKEGSQWRGRAVWFCPTGRKENGGCGFFHPDDAAQPSMAAQQAIANTHVAPVNPSAAAAATVHLPSTGATNATNLNPGRKRSPDEAGLEDFSSTPADKRRHVSGDTESAAVVSMDFGARSHVVVPAAAAPVPPPSNMFGRTYTHSLSLFVSFFLSLESFAHTNIYFIILCRSRLCSRRTSTRSSRRTYCASRWSCCVQVWCTRVLVYFPQTE